MGCDEYSEWCIKRNRLRASGFVFCRGYCKDLRQFYRCVIPFKNTDRYPLFLKCIPIQSSKDLLLTERKDFVSSIYIFSKNQNTMSKIIFPYWLLGERSNPPALFLLLQNDSIHYRSLKTSQQPPEGYPPQGTAEPQHKPAPCSIRA